MKRDVGGAHQREHATTSSLSLSCCGCHRQLRLPIQHAGKRVRCPACQTITATPRESGFASPQADLGADLGAAGEEPVERAATGRDAWRPWQVVLLVMGGLVAWGLVHLMGGMGIGVASDDKLDPGGTVRRVVVAAGLGGFLLFWLAALAVGGNWRRPPRYAQAEIVLGELEDPPGDTRPAETEAGGGVAR